MSPNRVRGWARSILATGAALVAVSLIAFPAHADDADADGIGISVPVVGTSAPAKSTPPVGRTASAASQTSGANTVATDSPAPVPAAGDMEIAGGLYLSDISGTSRPTLNPLEGTTELWVTLRNLSSETIDATADFSLATAFGTRIDGAGVHVRSLKPKETRVVTATLSGSGQWPFVVGRVTLTPPARIDGQETAAVSRAAVVYVLPWLLLTGFALIALAVVLLRITATTIGAPCAVPSAGVA
ncbi:hypothetical protein SK224_16025 [Microbacterium sp. BG28]|uniref:hypothetical protein n=1 Tax=Microbacterium sp. BG28 TaxID=3097356 RepID=UPI002A5A2E46|nr:hypothetical protein [Microbacterium sp. BG28]MDY0830644.1 hypothetical protein [Microbacterium sp. BG28]